MSLDLEMWPVRNREDMSGAKVYCFDGLRFAGDYELFGQLRDLSHYTEKMPTITPRPLPEALWVESYGEPGCTRSDKYGNPLTFVYAEELRRLAVSETTAPFNRAIVAFLHALPPETPVILMWC
jgi:hypothetical protein